MASSTHRDYHDDHSSMRVSQKLSRFKGWPLLLVWGVSLLLCVAVWWGTAHLMEQEKREFDSSVGQSLSNLTRLSAEHANRTLHSAETALKYLQIWFDANPQTRPPLSVQASRGIFDMTIFNQVGIIGADGMLLYSNVAQTTPINLTDRAHFKYHIDNTSDAIFVSRPVVGRASGKSSIQLTRRISRPDGSFAGVAVVSIATDYFNAFYDSLNIGANGAATLAGMDGFVRARRGSTTHAPDTNLSASPAIERMNRGERVGSFRLKSITDGVERLYHYRQLADYPLWVSIGLGSKELSVDLESHQHIGTATAASISLLLLSLATVLTWHRWGESRQREALRAKHALLMNLTDQLPHELFQFRVYPDGHSGFPFASKHLLDFYQVTQEQIEHDASAVFGLQHPDDRDLIAQSMAQAIRSQTAWQQEYRLLLPGNVTVWRSGSAQPQKMADGSVLWHGLVTDITERKRTEDELRVSATAFQSTQAMVITDANGQMQRANPAFLDMFGFHESEIQGRNPSMMASGRHDKLFYQDLWQHLQLHRTWTGEIWNRRKSGEVFPDWLHISAVTDDSGAISHYVATHTDLTARKRLEDEVRQMAYFDPLTQLPNRRLLQDRLEQACMASSRTGSHGAVVFLDLDHFKQLNDTRGHETGDALLLQVAQRLRQCVREGDTVARLGGDEFILILVNLSASEPEATAQARAIGEKIVRSIAEPFDLLGTPYACTCSVGFTLFHDRSHPMKSLIQTADRAMYSAKARGRNGLAYVALGPVHPNATTEPTR